MGEIQAENGSVIAEVIASQGRVVTVPVGISMWPMLKNRKDHIVIQKVDRPLRKYDVPMYRRPGLQNKYVLHRIIKVNKNGGYIICGDNLWKKEYDITDEEIVGVLKGFFKGEKYIDCESSKGYHCYVYVWRFLYPLRACLLWGKMQLGRVKRKLTSRKEQGIK